LVGGQLLPSTSYITYYKIHVAPPNVGVKCRCSQIRKGVMSKRIFVLPQTFRHSVAVGRQILGRVMRQHSEVAGDRNVPKCLPLA